MILLVAGGVGFLAARLAWVLLRPVLAAGAFRAENHRGRGVPTAAGLVLAVAAIVVESSRVVASAGLEGGSGLDSGRLGMLVLVVGVALLGLVDDLAGGADQRGFRGHLGAMREGRLTTGGLKMVGGAAVALLAVAATRPDDDLGYLLVDAALVALAANLGNLFDRAPGRAIKVGALCFAVLVVTTAAAPGLVPAAVVVAGSLALLPEDLRERMMLGDTGANLLGGAIGLAVVAVGGPVVRLAVLGGLAILNGVSEWVSFSRVIDAVPPLRALDRAGRRSA